MAGEASAGYVPFEVIREKIQLPTCWSETILRQHTRLDHKDRFEWDNEGRCRASNGHTYQTGIAYERVGHDTLHAWHATPIGNVESIMQFGIKPGFREYVHLVPSRTDHHEGSRAVAKLQGKKHVNILVDLRELEAFWSGSYAYVLTKHVPPSAIIAIEQCLCGDDMHTDQHFMQINRRYFDARFVYPGSWDAITYEFSPTGRMMPGDEYGFETPDQDYTVLPTEDELHDSLQDDMWSYMPNRHCCCWDCHRCEAY